MYCVLTHTKKDQNGDEQVWAFLCHVSTVGLYAYIRNFMLVLMRLLNPHKSYYHCRKMSKRNVRHTKRDSDPNVLQAGLQCQRCGKVEYSQGNLHIHLFRETNHGKPYAVLCGCCGSLFKFPKLLANHLNQTGATVRAPFVILQQVRQVTPFGDVPRAAAASVVRRQHTASVG